MSSSPTRRRFLTTTLAGMAAPTVLASAVLGKDGQVVPSDRIGVAMLGVGNRGTSSMHAMSSLPDHQIVAIADCRQERLELAGQKANKTYAARTGKEKYQGVNLTGDFREAIHRDDVDVVWGCVPDHWHGVAYSEAIRAGKDMYGEKPISRYIGEGTKLVELVKEYGTIFQTGTQQRSQAHFRHACNLAINGYLGKVKQIKVGAPGGQEYPSVAPSTPPAGFDYDRWTGPAPFIPFDTRRCEWLAMYMISHYCAGFITNWGVHHLDIAGWGVPEVFEKPFTVEGKGVMPSGGMTDTWIRWQCELQWESGLKMSFTNSDNPNKQGCRFEGDEGWVHVNRQGIWAGPESLLEVKLKSTDQPLHVSPIDSDGYYGYTSHTADLFRSIRTRQAPVSPIEQGHAASTLGNAADLALRLNRKLTWDPAAQHFDDDEANRLLLRAYCGPWMM